jgi:hypothetical protein
VFPNVVTQAMANVWPDPETFFFVYVQNVWSTRLVVLPLIEPIAGHIHLSAAAAELLCVIKIKVRMRQSFSYLLLPREMDTFVHTAQIYLF